MFQTKFMHKEKTIIDENDVDNILYTIISRKRFTYNAAQVLQYFLRCLCMRKMADIRRRIILKTISCFQKAD
jgi:hypothetical protein